MKHTPGPLTPHDGSSRIVDGQLQLMACAEWAYVSVEQAQINARLLAAAWTSYDKHCGPRAVECAEGDLLGEALEALQTILAWLEASKLTTPPGPGLFSHSDIREVAAIRSVLAKATGELRVVEPEEEDDGE